MRREQTEVLVIGGGATGTGVMRDLAMRGFDTIGVEQRDLTHGTTGRYHGLLHSGGRYVVKDPDAAVECIEENMVLRRIMPHCIEDTGGFFVTTPEDDLDYIPRFLAGCESAGIEVAEIPVSEALRREPYLNPRISHCFEVPDASADSFLTAISTVESAREHGGRFLPYHEVIELVRTGDRVVGARCHDLVNGEDVEIAADMVVNASGAWAGRIAGTAGVHFEVQAGKGTMLAVNHRMLNTVVNRCKMPDDGDIIVPIRTVAVIGTTDEGVPDPERFSVEPWEVQLMLEEGEKLVPGISQMRVLRAWAGVRPLYQEEAADDTRDVTRAYALLDHATRDGIDGFLTITGGKWTTFRQMAEVTVDAVCAKLNVERECRTHLEPLPDRRNRGGYHWLGERLARIEKEERYGDLVCECELATRADVTRAIVEGQAATIDDVRRDVRVGMGPCQGGWCMPRVTGMFHQLHESPVVESNAALRDFVHERWKGLLPSTWGDQLRQARLDDLIFTSLLNVGGLPGPATTPLGPVMYEPATNESRITARTQAPDHHDFGPSVAVPETDVIVVGGGLAGLTAAWQAASAGAATTLLTKGWGSLIWHAGTVDVLGYLDTKRMQMTTELRADLTRLITDDANHPYARVGIDTLEDALAGLSELCAEAGYPLVGGLEANLVLPTGLGGARPTALAPVTMAAGELGRSDDALIVGFDRYLDFFPDLVADNLTARGVPARAATLRLDTLQRRRFVYATNLADLFETEDFRQEVADAVSALGGATRVGFPAVLGHANAAAVVADLSERIGAQVFEISSLPPSVPGLRLQRILRGAIAAAGGRIVDNAEAVGATSDPDGGVTVTTLAAARRQRRRASRVVLATGGLLGGGVVGNPDGTLTETVAGLPVKGPSRRTDWFERDPVNGSGHPLFRAGVAVGPDLGIADNPQILVAGNLIYGNDPVRQGTLEGIALATGWATGRRAAMEAKT